MNRDEVAKKVIGILSDSLSVPENEIKEESSLGSLGADSLDAVNAIMDVEKSFDIHFEDKVAEAITDVRGIIDAVMNNLPKDTAS